jgi:branched-chain amino acid transport system substrate-binding protein
MKETRPRKVSRRTFLKYSGAVGLGGITVLKGTNAAAQASKPIVVGLTSDASGNYADSGAAERRGMVMALEEFNAGGVLTQGGV